MKTLSLKKVTPRIEEMRNPTQKKPAQMKPRFVREITSTLPNRVGSEPKHLPGAPVAVESIKRAKPKLSKTQTDAEAADKAAKQKRIEYCGKYLAEKYPDTFDFKNPKPLSIGIREELLQRPLPADISKTLLRTTFAKYVCSWKYKKSLRLDAERIGLDGKVTGTVTADQVIIPEKKPAQAETVAEEVDE